MWHQLTEEQVHEMVARGVPKERICEHSGKKFIKCDAGLAFGPDGPLLPCLVCEMEEAAALVEATEGEVKEPQT